MPRAVEGSSSGTVDEDGLANGITLAQPGDVAGAALTASGSVTGLFNSGADTPLTYSFNTGVALPAGLTSNQIALSYVVSANLITATAGIGGAPVFTMSLNATTGAWTFTLQGVLDHPTAGTEDDITINFGPLVQATDDDGDTVAAIGSVSVTIDDDMPAAFVADTIYADDVSGFMTSGNINFANVAGADGVGTVTFNIPVGGTLAIDTNGNQILLNGAAITLYYGSDPTILVGTTGTSANTGTLAFTLDLNPVTGTYSFVINNGPITNGSEVNFTNLAGVGGGNNLFKALGTTIAGPNDILISGSDTVNTSAQNIGIGSAQGIGGNGGGDIARFDFLADITQVTAAPSNGNTGFNYSAYYSLSSFTQELDFVNPGGSGVADFTVRIIDADNDYAFIGDAGDTFINSPFTVKIYSGDPDLPGSVVVATINSIAGVATVTGMLEGQYYVVESATPFEAVQIQGISGTRNFKLGEISIETVSDLDPFQLAVPLTGTDGDGDTAAGGISINFLPDATTTAGDNTDNILNGTNLAENLLGQGGNDTISGLGGNDLLAGGLGNDTLIGGLGLDTLSGGGGADVFVIDPSHLTLALDDLIVDYNQAQGDKIDLTDLFQMSVSDTNLANYVRITGFSLEVDVNGLTGGQTFAPVATVNGAVAGTINILFTDQNGNETNGTV